jgi:hypothetical protein
MTERPKIITSDLSVGITPAIATALQIYCAATGIRPSQYGRLAIMKSLVHDGLMPGLMQQSVHNADAKT